MRTVGAGLCHSDLHFMEGMFRLKVPAVLGHESAGVVEAVGEGVTYVQPGDHVVCCLSIFCGVVPPVPERVPEPLHEPGGHVAAAGRAPPRLSRDDGTPVGQFARLGGFAELMLVHENGVVKVTEDIPLDKVALIGCGVLTGSGAVFRTAGVEPGSRVCVIGAGGIGLAAIQAARIAGAGDGDRGRRQRRQAGDGPPARRHRDGQRRRGRQRGRGGAGALRRRRRLQLRGDRQEGHRRAGVQDARRGRHGHRSSAWCPTTSASRSRRWTCCPRSDSRAR